MSLESLVGVSLDTITPSRETAQRRLAAVARLDYLRKQRNVTEYSGDLVTDAEVAECMKQAEALCSFALGWLKKNKKDLL